MMPSHSEAEAGPTIVAANDWSLGIEERPDMTATQWQLSPSDHLMCSLNR